MNALIRSLFERTPDAAAAYRVGLGARVIGFIVWFLAPAVRHWFLLRSIARKDSLRELQLAVQKARAEGKEQIDVAWLPRPIRLKEAEDIAKTFEDALEDIQHGSFDQEKQGATSREPAGKKKNLILLGNIRSLDYEERRRSPR